MCRPVHIWVFWLNAKNVTSGSSSIYVDKNGSIPIDAILQQAQLPVLGTESFDHSENITSDIHRFNLGGQGAAWALPC